MIQRETAVNKKTKNKKRNTFLEIFKKVVFWFIFFGFCAVVVWTVIFSPAMQIEEIDIVGAAEDEIGIRQIVEKEMSGKYFDFFPRNNLLIAPLEKIQLGIRTEFIMTRNVRVEKKFPSKIVLEVERRKDSFVWCSNNSCWLIDEIAEAFYEIKNQEKELKEDIVLITDRSGRVVEKGDKVAHIEIVELCNKLPKIMKEDTDIEIDIKSLYIPSLVAGEVRVKTKVGWEIYFSTERSLEKQVKILKKILTVKISEIDLAQLEYVDLRVKGKVVYRFRDYKEREKELEEVAVKGVSDEKIQEAKTETEREDKKKDVKKNKDK